jgi:predicted phosphohydrolase
MNSENLNIQIASDLHIEYKNDLIPDPLTYIEPVSEILILAGDIGSLYKYEQLQKFLEKLCQYFKIVLYIPGNHEYYTVRNIKPLKFNELEKILTTLEESINNLYILNRSSIIINDICITGCTLWSKLNTKIPKFIVKINDLDDHIYENMFNTDLKHINNMIKYCKNKNLKLIVATHYCPTYDVLNFPDCLRSKKDKYISLYVSNLDYILNKNLVNTWICGHIHYNFDFISTNGTRIVGNQLGKPRDNIINYNKKFIISII